MSENQPANGSAGSRISWTKRRPVRNKTNPNVDVRSRRIPRIRLVFWTLAFMSSLGFGFYVRAEIQRRTFFLTEQSLVRKPHEGGVLLIAGGGHLNDLVRLRFIELAGRNEARIVVIPAVPTEDSMEEPYRELWAGYDVKTIDILHSDSRAQSDDAEFSRVLETATGVWLSGGTQSWMADRYGKTLVERRLKDLLARNGVIGGTSAGAAIMSGVMIASGRERPVISEGFGLIDTAIIDQHFVKRNRFRRLKTAVLQHPGLIGFGIDEGAALQYSVGSGRFDILGSSCVVACVAGIDGDQRHNIRVEFFNAGDEFDIVRLRRGEDVPPSFVDFEGILLGD